MPSGRFLWRRLFRCALGLACLVLAMASAQAVTTLTWDPNISGAPSDGSGTWHGGNTWWNGTADQAWADASAVVIGATTPGTYSITLDTAVSATTVTFKTNSYTLSGSTLTESGITLSSGVSAAITCNLTTAGGGCSVGNGGAALTLGGSYNSTGGNPSFNGSGQAVSTLNITNGTHTSAGTETYNNITANQTGGVVAFAIWNIGRTAAARQYNLSGGTLRNTTVNALSISRGFPGVFNLSGSGLLGAFGNLPIAGNTTTDNGTLNVLGGIANIGTGIGGTPGVTSASLANITLLALGSAGTYTAAASGILNISGGSVTAKGIQFGSSVSSYVNNPVCRFNLTGGLLYLDANGLALGTGVTGFSTPAITLSGGTIAATANWTGSMPMTLTNINGNLTVQAADVNGTPWSVTLSGGLSGQGGLIKTGGGILTLSGPDSYTGTTTVSNGQLTVSTAAATSIGPVSLSSGTTLSTVLAAAGRTWTNAGLVLGNSVTVDFNFGGFQLSPSGRVIQVNGDLTLDSSDNCTIEGNSILIGTYPLMTCTGTLALTGGATLPTVTSMPSGVVASLAQSGKTINLVVTDSPNSPLNWGPLAAGPWNFTTTDWVNAGTGSPTNYSDGIAVTFNDNANSAVVITLNNNVQPVSVTANNTAAGTASYAISGPGSIGGNTSVLLQGTGLLALGTTNTYSGGTMVNSGTLSINYGGDGSGPSAIGTGPLTLNPGAALDNTSGSNVVLNTPLTEYWNGSFAYAGSQTNLSLGTGPVILGNSIVGVTVLSNILTCGGAITDNGLNYQLAVQGPGALTLSGLNTYIGGTVLNSGKLNINNGGDGGADSALGTGSFTINGGTVDNTSGLTSSYGYPSRKPGTPTLPSPAPPIWTWAPGPLGVNLGADVAKRRHPEDRGRDERGGLGSRSHYDLERQWHVSDQRQQDNPGLSVVVNGGLYLMDKTSSASVHSGPFGLEWARGGIMILFDFA